MYTSLNFSDRKKGITFLWLGCENTMSMTSWWEHRPFLMTQDLGTRVRYLWVLWYVMRKAYFVKIRQCARRKRRASAVFSRFTQFTDKIHCWHFVVCPRSAVHHIFTYTVFNYIIEQICKSYWGRRGQDDLLCSSLRLTRRVVSRVFL